MSEDEEIRAALAANAEFYDALASGNYGAMDELWAATTPVLCTHPGTPALHGREAVMESWRDVLSSPPPVTCSSSRVAVVRGLAFVTCLEHIGDGTLAASNVFVWENRSWKLVHHQSGALSTLDPETPAPGDHLH